MTTNGSEMATNADIREATICTCLGLHHNPNHCIEYDAASKYPMNKIRDVFKTLRYLAGKCWNGL
jgi:hypothetical protein